MPGSNLSYKNGSELSELIGRALGFSIGTFRIQVSGKLATKAGVPATNTANDQPNAVGDMCYNTSASSVYISTLNTDSTHHTWVKISP